MSPLFSVIDPPRIPFFNGGNIFFDVIRMPPIRHIVAFVSEDVRCRNRHTSNSPSVLVPALTTVNTEALAPRIIDFAPCFKSKVRVVTLLDCLCIRIGIKLCHCRLWSAFKILVPSVISTAVLKMAIVPFFHFVSGVHFKPKRSSILEVKKVLRSHGASLCGTNGEKQNG